MRKILFINSSLAFGGAEVVLAKQCEILHKHGFLIDVICTDNFGYIGRRLEKQGFNIYDITTCAEKNEFVTNHILMEKPDIVYINNSKVRPAIKATKELINYKLIIHLHECLKNESSLSNLMLETYGSWIDHVISMHPKAFALAQAKSQANHVLLLNPVDKTFFAAPFGRNKKNVVGYCGRISPEKNLLTFVKTVARAKRDIPDISVLLIGDADPNYRKCVKYKERVLAALEHHEIPFIITGFIDDCATWVNQMKVAVLLSDAEGFSNFVWEATALGIPVVSTDVGSSYLVVPRNHMVDFRKPMIRRASRLMVINLENGKSKAEKKALRKAARAAHEAIYEEKFLNLLLS